MPTPVPTSAEASSEKGRADAPGFMDELRDALSPRAILLVVAVLAVQLGFVLSYIGAFHAPSPHRIPVAVVASDNVAAQIVKQLDGLDGNPVKAAAVADEATARTRIKDRTVDAAFLFNATGTTDKLLVASAGGPSVSLTATQIAQKIEAAQKRTVDVVDILPPANGDGRGMSSFYLVVGWMVGGYLAAAILGTAGGARPANHRRALIRLGSLAVYAIASGLGGAVIVGPALGALPGHFTAVWSIGALVVFAAAATTTALQILFGVLGIGVAILLFVVLGNPSAGGAYPSSLLPPFWRAIGQALPPGAGTTMVRNTVYFSGNATTGPLLVLTTYALVGVVISLTGAGIRRGSSASTQGEVAEPSALLIVSE